MQFWFFVGADTASSPKSTDAGRDENGIDNGDDTKPEMESDLDENKREMDNMEMTNE